MRNIIRTLPFQIGMIATIPLVAALISQYVFGLYPCVLCIYQRIPYALVMVLCAFYMLFRSRLLKPLLWVCITAFVVDAGIAFFHVGVEYKWWEGTSKCAGAAANSIEALRAALMNAPISRCDDPQFELLLTMAGWNVLYALFATFYCVRGYRATSRG